MLAHLADVEIRPEEKQKKLESAMATLPMRKDARKHPQTLADSRQWVESRPFVAVFKEGDALSRSDAQSEAVPRPGFRARSRHPRLEFERMKLHSR